MILIMIPFYFSISIFSKTAETVLIGKRDQRVGSRHIHNRSNVKARLGVGYAADPIPFYLKSCLPISYRVCQFWMARIGRRNGNKTLPIQIRDRYWVRGGFKTNLIGMRDRYRVGRAPPSAWRSGPSRAAAWSPPPASSPCAGERAVRYHLVSLPPETAGDSSSGWKNRKKQMTPKGVGIRGGGSRENYPFITFPLHHSVVIPRRPHHHYPPSRTPKGLGHEVPVVLHGHVPTPFE